MSAVKEWRRWKKSTKIKRAPIVFFLDARFPFPVPWIPEVPELLLLLPEFPEPLANWKSEAFFIVPAFCEFPSTQINLYFPSNSNIFMKFILWTMIYLFLLLSLPFHDMEFVWKSIQSSTFFIWQKTDVIFCKYFYRKKQENSETRPAYATMLHIRNDTIVPGWFRAQKSLVIRYLDIEIQNRSRETKFINWSTTEYLIHYIINRKTIYANCENPQ